MKLYLHFIENGLQDPPIDTYIAEIDSDLTILELIKLAVVNCRKDIAVASIDIFKEFEDKPPERASQVSETFKDNDDVFLIFTDASKPLKAEKKTNQLFQTITKYAFLDDEKKVLVYLELPGIGTVPNTQIQTRFLERSFEIKIRGYNGKNLVFAVPKTQCALIPDKSAIVKKQDKIVVHLIKTSEKDHWYSLYKTKAIGETDDT